MLQAWGIERRPITKYGLHLSYCLDGLTQWIITWEKSVCEAATLIKYPTLPSLLQFLKLQTPQVCSLLAGSHYNAIMYLAALSVESDCCADRYQVEQIAVLHMTQCPSAPILCALSFFFPHFCCFQHWSLVTHFSLLFGSLNMKTQGQVLKHISTHRGSLCTTGNYLKRMEQMRGGGVLIALWDGSAGQRDVNWRGCHFYVHLIHCSPWWVAGGSVTVFMCTC